MIALIVRTGKVCLDEAVRFVKNAYGPHNEGLAKMTTDSWEQAACDLGVLADNIIEAIDEQVSWRDVYELSISLSNVMEEIKKGGLDHPFDLELLLDQMENECGNRSYAETLLRRFRFVIMEVPNV